MNCPRCNTPNGITRSPSPSSRAVVSCTCNRCGTCWNEQAVDLIPKPPPPKVLAKK